MEVIIQYYYAIRMKKLPTQNPPRESVLFCPQIGTLFAYEKAPFGRVLRVDSVGIFGIYFTLIL